RRVLFRSVSGVRRESLMVHRHWGYRAIRSLICERMASLSQSKWGDGPPASISASGLVVNLARGVTELMTPSVIRMFLDAFTSSWAGIMAASTQARGKAGFIRITVRAF